MRTIYVFSDRSKVVQDNSCCLLVAGDDNSTGLGGASKTIWRACKFVDMRTEHFEIWDKLSFPQRAGKMNVSTFSK
jgi:hypothetical protein